MVQIAQKTGVEFLNFDIKSLSSKIKFSNKDVMILAGALLATQVMGANGLPFYDKLEFGIKIVKVIGGVIALIAFVAAIYMHKQGRSESLMTAVWFCMAGILTANVEWLAEQFGFLQGVLIA